SLCSPVGHPGDERSEIGQSMYGFDAHDKVRGNVPRGIDERDDVGLRSYAAAMVDVDAARCRFRNLSGIERGKGTRYDRPGVRMGSRFPVAIPSVELGEGGVDVVGVEREACHDPVVEVDLDEPEYLRLERL